MLKPRLMMKNRNLTIVKYIFGQINLRLATVGIVGIVGVDGMWVKAVRLQILFDSHYINLSLPKPCSSRLSEYPKENILKLKPNL